MVAEDVILGNQLHTGMRFAVVEQQTVAVHTVAALPPDQAADLPNMKDVYYNPAEYEPSLFSSLEDNIKEDRTPEDLLFQVMLDLGILLSSKIQVRSEKVGMRNYSYFDVEDGYLIACFDKNIDEEVITAIAKQKPYYFVMRDSSMANDSVATNFEQIFASYSPDTVRKVL